jgi:CheY-like chemotaxis protein
VDAQSALNVVESGVAIDVLFTDVVMPGTLKSPELARMARKRLPNVAVLFTSGYTENAIVHGGRLDAGVDLLSKPYTREALARKIRQVLANRPNDGGVTGVKATGAGATVLLVEDDPLIRATAADMLRQAGHGVIEVDSTEAALVALETAAIDVLVTDIHLPGHSGLELAERAAQLRPGVRIVIASGDTSAIVAPPVGAILLPKPYDGAALHEAVRVDAGEPGGRG